MLQTPLTVNLQNPLLQHADFETAGSTPQILIETGSDGYAAFWINIGMDIEELLYDLTFLEPGDGDWLETLFNGVVLQSIQGTSFPLGTRTVYIDMSDFAGMSGTLAFALRSTGPQPASIRITNVNFAISESVPEPPTIFLLAIGLLGWGYARVRS